MFIFLLTLTICLAFILIRGLFLDSEGSVVFGSVCLLIVAMFGWGLIACSVEQSYREVKANVIEVVHAKHAVLVSTKEKNIIFEGNQIDFINDTTKFYWRYSINMYGYEANNTQLIFK